MMSRRRPLTLIEVVVTLALAAWLLTALLFFIQGLWRLPQQLNHARHALLTQEMLLWRLEDTLGRACLLPHAEEGGLTSYGSEVVFNCPPTGGSPTGIVWRARLCLSDQGALVLVRRTHPLWDDAAVDEHTQVWMEGVASMRCHFLHMPCDVPCDVAEEGGYTPQLHATWERDSLPHACLIDLVMISGSRSRWVVWLKTPLVHCMDALPAQEEP